MIKCWNCGIDFEIPPLTNDALRDAYNLGYERGKEDAKQNRV